MVNQRWSFATWFPFAVVSCAAAAYLFVVVDDGIPAPSGPGGGGEGIFALVVMALRFIVLIPVVLCAIFHPRGAALNAKAVLTSTALWSLAFVTVTLLGWWAGITVIRVQTLDLAGRPISNVGLHYKLSKNFPLMVWSQSDGTATSDSAGLATFRVGAFDQLYIYGDSDRHPIHEVAIYNEGFRSEMDILYSIKGASDRGTKRLNPPRGSNLDVSITFDQTTSP